MDFTKDWIKKCEGLKLDTYIDTTGNLTIGWGRCLRNGINLDEAELMFQNDYKRSVDELELYDWFLNQPDGVKSALINMNFNLGIYKLLEFKEMIEALENKDYTKAAFEAMDSLWGRQVPQRAKDISVMISEGK